MAEEEGALVPQKPGQRQRQPRPASQDALGLECPFELSPLGLRHQILCSDESLDVGCSRKWGDCGQEGSLKQRLTVNWVTAIGHLRLHSQEVGQQGFH